MDAIEALTERVSIAQLTGPDITASQKEILFKAALRAPDHAFMRPSRYIILEGDARARLSEIFYSQQAGREVLSPEKAKKVKTMLLRAPLVIVAVTHLEEHPKVPRDEQILSTGAGVQNMLNAAFAMGLGAIWRTGAMVDCHAVRKALGLGKYDVITAFLYVGHPNKSPKPLPDMPLSDYVTEWTGETS